MPANACNACVGEAIFDMFSNPQKRSQKILFDHLQHFFDTVANIETPHVEPIME
jgi:hypothetical protein